MRRLIVVPLLFVLLSLCVAKDKITSQWKCDAKPSEEHGLAVGDKDGHLYNINQGKCTAEKGDIAGDKQQLGTWTQFDEIMGGNLQDHGILVVTMASGDKILYKYHGSQTTKDGKLTSGSNIWTISGGTGKYVQAKGEGTCKAQPNADGSSTWNCDGTFGAGK